VSDERADILGIGVVFEKDGRDVAAFWYFGELPDGVKSVEGDKVCGWPIAELREISEMERTWRAS